MKWRYNLRSVGLSTLLLLVTLVAGCDSASHGDSSGGGNTALPSIPRQPQPNPTLVVNLATATTGVAADVLSFDVIAYDIRGAELERQTGAPLQTLSFFDLPAGSIDVRVVALGENDATLGFSDTSAAIPSQARIDALPLTLTPILPPPATPGAPFLAFTGLPATYDAGVGYSIEVSAFNAQGQLENTASGSIGLSSSGISAVTPAVGVSLTNGRATFPSIVFTQGSNGTVTFTATASGFQSVTSPTLPVRSN